ncbi:hypothetical protein AURDEDRAFT_177473 [Auricularia subglabra TFB-10046 SS5]|uniref:Uncharacterized protein n=1 Tax=Auricularia subglabra (strain TFB-10046 / SS5) TaxID=717982 RepID=J0WMA0_AURST|nr:hypothetical protein AURDEDRAFT_177473 [Auricularia subglabra TFB-10046 SS5]
MTVTLTIGDEVRFEMPPRPREVPPPRRRHQEICVHRRAGIIPVGTGGLTLVPRLKEELGPGVEEPAVDIVTYEEPVARRKTVEHHVRSDHLSPVKLAVLPHLLETKRQVPIPPSMRKALVTLLDEGIKARVDEAGDSRGQRSWFCVVEKVERNLRIVHDLQPMNEDAIREAGLEPQTDEFSEEHSDFKLVSIVNLHSLGESPSRTGAHHDLAGLEARLGALRMIQLPMSDATPTPVPQQSSHARMREAQPSNKYAKRDDKFEWTTECTNTDQLLKERVHAAPELGTINYTTSAEDVRLADTTAFGVGPVLNSAYFAQQFGCRRGILPVPRSATNGRTFAERLGTKLCGAGTQPFKVPRGEEETVDDENATEIGIEDMGEASHPSACSSLREIAKAWEASRNASQESKGTQRDRKHDTATKEAQERSGHRVSGHEEAEMALWRPGF